MDFNTFATWVGIVSGILSIIPIFKELLQKDNVAIKQTNRNGDNIYIDRRTNTTINITNNSNSPTSGNDDMAFGIICIIMAIVTGVLSLGFYSQVYKLLPLIGLVLFMILAWKQRSVPFEGVSAKVYWFFSKVVYLILIFALFFIPNSIMELLNKIPSVAIESLPALTNWFDNILNISKSLWDGDRIILFNIVGRILGSFAIIWILLNEIRYKTKIHVKPKFSAFIKQLVFLSFFIIILNLDFVWNTALPLREYISNTFSHWINPNQ
ncbi:TPA: hypothetical protein RJW76_001481 [Enterococcus faecalis]|nr:hypothetical protein [Enterococcus faecalis]HDP1317247.1 hypothetical protein [Enterococcus faecalis]HDV6623423.1 hypothetical protein [Enterococcus faecalis]